VTAALVDPALSDPALRESCRGQLLRELLLRLVLHDLRNSMTAITGWFELLRIDGMHLPGGLERGIDSLGLIVQRYDCAQLVATTAPAPLGALISHHLDLEVVGGDTPAPLDPLRFLSALELAAPSRVTFQTLDDAPVALRVQLDGLSEDAVGMALSPHPAGLLSRVQRPDSVLGAALMRVVVQGARGELRRAGGALELLFP